jgi:hypothetical protein
LVPVSASSSGSAIVPVLSAAGTANSLVTFHCCWQEIGAFAPRR